MLGLTEIGGVAFAWPDASCIYGSRVYFVTWLFFRPGSAALFPEPDCCYPTWCCLVAAYSCSIYQQAGSKGLCALVRVSLVMSVHNQSLPQHRDILWKTPGFGWISLPFSDREQKQFYQGSGWDCLIFEIPSDASLYQKYMIMENISDLYYLSPLSRGFLAICPNKFPVDSLLLFCLTSFLRLCVWGLHR